MISYTTFKQAITTREQALFQLTPCCGFREKWNYKRMYLKIAIAQLCNKVLVCNFTMREPPSSYCSAMQ